MIDLYDYDLLPLIFYSIALYVALPVYALSYCFLAWPRSTMPTLHAAAARHPLLFELSAWAGVSLFALGLPCQPDWPNWLNVLSVVPSVTCALAAYKCRLQRKPVSANQPAPGRGRPCITDLIAQLNSDEATTRAAVQALANIGPSAVPFLADALGSLSDSTRYFAAEALSGVQEPPCAAMSALAGLLQDQKPRIRRMAAYALAWPGEAAASAVPELIRSLDDCDASVRDDVAWALGLIGQAAAPAVPDLQRLLTDNDPGVRRQAACALGRIGAQAACAIPALLQACSDDYAVVRKAAAAALKAIGPEVISALGQSHEPPAPTAPAELASPQTGVQS